MDIKPPEHRDYIPPPPQLPSTSADPESEGGAFRSILSTVILIATAFSIAILLNTFVIQSYQVDGESMESTLQNDDRLIVNKIPRTISRITHHQYVPNRGDIIIFNQELGVPGFEDKKQLIKRVIGLPGERVVVADNKITVYNKQSPNGFNPDTAGKYKIDADKITAGSVDLVLDKDQIFVSGDNRPNSEDSRYFGPVSTNQVVAKLVLRMLPLNKVSSY